MPDHPLSDLKPHLPPRFPYAALTYARLPGTWHGNETQPHTQTFTPGPRLSITTVEQVAAMSDAELLDVQRIGPRWLGELRKAVAAALGAQPERHRPARGSDVERWLKRHRDQHGGGRWNLLDDMIEEYREHADTGTPLDFAIDQTGPPNA